MIKLFIGYGATVTLKDATIDGTHSSSHPWAGITCLGDATIILKGTNSVMGSYYIYPGIQPAHKDGTEDYTLTIKGDGELTVSPFDSGDATAAGIGGGNNIPSGNIVIEGGTINVRGGASSGAGIGGGSGSGSCGNITIKGGTINAIGGGNGAGIGGGYDHASCKNITISGGVIDAKGCNSFEAGYGAGIGAGYNANCGAIKITGGTITAHGSNYGAGIGGGYHGSCKSIYIDGGEITATGGNNSGAGIGGGNVSPINQTIEITSGVKKVTATKVSSTDCIGQGFSCTCGTVTIGGVVGVITTSPYTYTP